MLSLAKANANVSTTGISRQQQQMLNHSVTELLEIAHIQDDLLERLRADDRIDPERAIEIEDALKGKIQGLSEVSRAYPSSHILLLTKFSCLMTTPTRPVTTTSVCLFTMSLITVTI